MHYVRGQQRDFEFVPVHGMTVTNQLTIFHEEGSMVPVMGQIGFVEVTGWSLLSWDVSDEFVSTTCQNRYVGPGGGSGTTFVKKYVRVPRMITIHLLPVYSYYTENFRLPDMGLISYYGTGQRLRIVGKKMSQFRP